jgi:hypothetical protein
MGGGKEKCDAQQCEKKRRNGETEEGEFYERELDGAEKRGNGETEFYEWEKRGNGEAGNYTSK